MSPVPLPVTNSTTTALTAARQASSTTTKMANSNTSYRQMAQTTQQSTNNNNNKNSNAAVTSTAVAASAVSANKLKAITMAETKLQQQHQKITKDTSANFTTTKTLPAVNGSSNNTTNAATTTTMANVITSQCDSSSGSSTTSSSSSSSNGSDINSINVKSETCDTEIKTELESSENGSETAGPADANDLQLAAMKHRPILLSSMNAHIICGLCFGYLIDATTIVECLHSFCHSCLIKHLRTEQYCPRCEMMINTAKPNIKPDTTLQAIVYKLVPGLYEKELMRKRAFYKDRPEEAALATPEQRGDDTEHLIFSPSDYMSISLEYADTDELLKSNSEYNELLKPRYLQCPAMCTVTHLKKLVYGKFEINSNRFTIDIMYKVKTIILLDHYTLMDVAYIYTWKRDAPMRFYFRVKQSLKPVIKVKKQLAAPLPKKEVASPVETTPELLSQAMCIVHEPSPLVVATDSKILEPEEIKQENEAEVSSTTEIPSPPMEKPKQFEIVQPQSPSVSSQDATPTDKLKITIVNKAAKDKSYNSDMKSPAPVKALKEKKESHKNSSSTPKDERKVENIKLKIDLSKQNSVTIINMSDPQRKEIVKPVRPEKEWKVTKTKKDKDGSPKSSPKSSPHSERKSKTPSPLTVPPITIKAERISPLAKLSSPSTPTSSKALAENPEDEQKSQFLKSFALAPIKDIKPDNKETSRLLSKEVTLSVVPKSSNKELTSSSSKRKSKEPVKAVIKKPKFSPPLATEDFKIKLPPIPSGSTKTSASVSSTTNASKKELMPPPAPLTVMKPPSALLKKPGKLQQSKVTAAPPGSLTPHPMHAGGIQLAPPGSRTPIAKRYQPILPKASRPNPFANIPSDVNKILKDAGTEIKSIPNEPVSTKVYGPKTDGNSNMGPPTMAAPSGKTAGTNASNSRNNSGSTKANSGKNNSYLNLALYNASKSKGNEVPPGCRTPMYTPNSPIYSPSSPQYVPNYNIPTVPTYKYTPKPSNSNSYLQSVLSSSNQMSSLFPSPPVKKDTNNQNHQTTAAGNNSNNRCEQPQSQKRVYPFARSPSPGEDPPEKQLKVKSLLNSCNINIPSSLSITITREDGDASSNGAAYPKHKSPVNNYIEILKLPEQTPDNSENKRLSPPAVNQLFPNPPMKRVATPPLNGSKPASNNNNNKLPNNIQNSGMVNSAPNSAGTVKATTNNNMSAANQQLMGKNNGINKSMGNNKPNAAPPSNNSKLSPGAISDKKTPSPEKRLPSQPVEQKSPKSPDGSACKKFRHILPRQITNPMPEVNVPKPNGNVIGTYSSPNGVNVKIHSNKKVQPSKKSPGVQQKPMQQPTGGTVKNPQQSPTAQSQHLSSNNKPAPKSAQTSKGSKANGPLPTASNASPKVNNPSTTNLPTLPPVMPHPMQAMLPPHLGAAAAACQNAASQAELSKFLKENLLRAQVQAAVANQSNMFYPYAANAAAAAQLGQFNPTMYNYQQAYIMDQLSRMQRAGNDAFTEYMQKLKNSMELQKTQSDGKAPEPSMKHQKNSTSPKSSSSNTPTAAGSAASSKEQVLGKTK